MLKISWHGKTWVFLSLALSMTLSACQIPASTNLAAPQMVENALAAPAGDSEVLHSQGLELPAQKKVQPLLTMTPTLPLPAAAMAQDALAKTDEAAPPALQAGEVVNPLTGQSCQDSSLLNLPPALVSVSNFPVTARPQAGLSYAPYVFELSIGEGMTRFLALFYCAFPDETVSGDNTIGPIRSGRLPYESLRKLYNGFLVMASASGEVKTHLAGSTNIFGSDSDNINSALVAVSKLKGIAQNQAGEAPPNLGGNYFDPAPASGGLAADRLWVFYSYLNQVMWTFDPASGTYLRAQDQADGSGQFVQSTDRLTGEPLAFDNVVVLFADHEVLNSEGTLIDVNLLYTLGKAYLFRDGQMFPIRWSTENGAYEKETGKLRPIRFEDAEGNPVALKPGNVWVEFVHLTTTLGETEPGTWKARFYAP